MVYRPNMDSRKLKNPSSIKQIFTKNRFRSEELNTRASFRPGICKRSHPKSQSIQSQASTPSSLPILSINAAPPKLMRANATRALVPGEDGNFIGSNEGGEKTAPATCPNPVGRDHATAPARNERFPDGLDRSSGSSSMFLRTMTPSTPYRPNMGKTTATPPSRTKQILIRKIFRNKGLNTRVSIRPAICERSHTNSQSMKT